MLERIHGEKERKTKQKEEEEEEETTYVGSAVTIPAVFHQICFFTVQVRFFKFIFRQS